MHALQRGPPAPTHADDERHEHRNPSNPSIPDPQPTRCTSMAPADETKKEDKETPSTTVKAEEAKKVPLTLKQGASVCAWPHPRLPRIPMC